MMPSHWTKKTFVGLFTCALLCATAMAGGQPLPHTVSTAPATEPLQTSVNLLKLMTLNQDVVRGNWFFQAGALICRPSQYPIVVFPYIPPAQYDFRITFTRISGNDSISMFCTAAGHEFDWDMGGWGNKFDGFEQVNGNDANNNPTLRFFVSCLQNRRKYTCLVKVRTNGVRAYINGRLISEWKTNYKDMSVRGSWGMPYNNMLGLSTQTSETIFYSATVTPVHSGNNSDALKSNPNPPAAHVPATIANGSKAGLGLTDGPDEQVLAGEALAGKFTSAAAESAEKKYHDARQSAMQICRKANFQAAATCEKTLSQLLLQAMAGNATVETRQLTGIITAISSPAYEPPLQSPITSPDAQTAWRAYVLAVAMNQGDYLITMENLRKQYYKALQKAMAGAINSGHPAEALRIDQVIHALQRADADPLISHRSLW